MKINHFGEVVSRRAGIIRLIDGGFGGTTKGLVIKNVTPRRPRRARRMGMVQSA
ncbi:MAG TPA: hypothetical protein VMX95_05340 [Thermodesulfobacteriota bacterium]|nr:hypothetical protein [Thermodesulfobacteriota bacterium]